MAGIANLGAISGDSVWVKKLVADHNPYGLEFDTKRILLIVEDILTRATLRLEYGSTGALALDVGHTNMLQTLSSKIDRISCEIAYKSLTGVDAHTTTVGIFDMLTNYNWDMKLVLALASFALTYGEFGLLAQIYEQNQLAKSMAILKQVSGIMERVYELKPRLDALNKLVKVILGVVKCVIQFKELPKQYITQEVSAYTTVSNLIPIAAYWTVRGIVACATKVTSLSKLGYEFMQPATEAWELPTLAHKLETILNYLVGDLRICCEHVEAKMNAEAYNSLIELFSTTHIDNMKVLQALISTKGDSQPLYDAATRKRVGLEVLRRKTVMLLISGLNISDEELLFLLLLYNGSRMYASGMESRFELVWIPYVDLQNSQWTDTMKRQYKIMLGNMPYSVLHPTLISKPVMWFIQKEWKYKNKPILVVLDPQGRVACHNAIHMMWIWGPSAFPFTRAREEALWKEERWRLELLVGSIDLQILNWVNENKYIFLYGGEDPEWVRKLAMVTRQVSLASRIPIEMVYIGKNNKREQVKRVLDIINREKLPTYSLQDEINIWFFWTRLESMLISKIQLKQDDVVLQKVKKLLSYEKQGGCVVLARGSDILVDGHASPALQTLIEYHMWKEHAESNEFGIAFKNHYEKLQKLDRPCCRLEFSHATGTTIPEKISCPECNRHMHMVTTFLCCHDETVE